MPITIGPLTKPRETLSLASYQPKTSLSDRPGLLVPALQAPPKDVSSTTWRKAAYAERDRTRARDPGALDFTLEEEDDEDEEQEETAKGSVDQGGSRGRQHALRILKVRSEVPASGMWRSLAS